MRSIIVDAMLWRPIPTIYPTPPGIHEAVVSAHRGVGVQDELRHALSDLDKEIYLLRGWGGAAGKEEEEEEAKEEAEEAK
jgi:hypothetical protein